jgi:hypothetical protein
MTGPRGTGAGVRTAPTGSTSPTWGSTGHLLVKLDGGRW